MQKQKIKRLAAKYKLKLIMVFGSFARGTAKANSDIDIAVVSLGKLSMSDELELAAELAEILKGEIDLAAVNHANPLFLHQISRDAVLLGGSKTDFFKFKLNAFHRYNDYAPYFKLEEQSNKRLIKHYVCR